jgi:hypothetical protein
MHFGVMGSKLPVKKKYPCWIVKFCYAKYIVLNIAVFTVVACEPPNLTRAILCKTSVRTIQETHSVSMTTTKRLMLFIVRIIQFFYIKAGGTLGSKGLS